MEEHGEPAERRNASGLCDAQPENGSGVVAFSHLRKRPALPTEQPGKKRGILPTSQDPGPKRSRGPAAPVKTRSRQFGASTSHPGIVGCLMVTNGGGVGAKAGGPPRVAVVDALWSSHALGRRVLR